MASAAFVASGAIALALAAVSGDARLQLGALAAISAALGLTLQALSRPTSPPAQEPPDQEFPPPAPLGWGDGNQPGPDGDGVPRPS